MIERHDSLSVRRQCELLALDRSGLYYAPAPLASGEIALCHRLDELYTARPHYGVRSMTTVLRREGHTINPKRVRRLLRQMGILAVYPKPRLSLPGAGAQVFPYLLRGLSIARPHQVWAIDITYVRLRGGFCYLVALLDWFRRFVLAWELCSGLETFYCLRVLEAAPGQRGKRRRDHQQRSGESVHEPGMDRGGAGAGHAGEPRWSWACARQRDRGTLLAHGEV